jgi:hypothetical protein
VDYEKERSNGEEKHAEEKGIKNMILILSSSALLLDCTSILSA